MLIIAMMAYILGRRQCVLLIWTFVGLQVLTVILLYTFHTGGHSKSLSLRSGGHKVNNKETHAHRGIMSYAKGTEKDKPIKKGLEFHKMKELSVRDSSRKGLSIEGDVIHLHIHGGKIIIHSDEISEEDFIRIKTTSQKRKTTKSPVRPISIHKRNVERRFEHAKHHVKKIEKQAYRRKTSTLKPIFKVTTKRSTILKSVNIKPFDQKLEPPHKSGNYRNTSKSQKLQIRTATSSHTEINTFINRYVKECERNLLNITYTFRGTTKTLCPCLPSGLGVVTVNPSPSEKFSPSGNHYDVRFNGILRPSSCVARQRVAVIVPYSNRKEHLEIFLRHMHNFLQKQLLEYSIIIVEQVSPAIFNRAALMNIGFVEANRLGMFHCFIFHDVDLLPEDSRNLYTCTTSPRHVAVAVDKFRYQLQYSTIVGGALAVTRDQMLTINGFSNKFYGWGGEDDDMYNRIRTKSYNVARYPEIIGRYTMLQHFGDDGNPPNPTGGVGLEMRPEEYDIDGLNTLKYKAAKPDTTKLYTLIKVQIQ